MGQESLQNIPAHLILPPQQIVSSTQAQCQRIQRDGQIADFRKFKQNFVLSSAKGQRSNVSYNLRCTLRIEKSKNKYLSHSGARFSRINNNSP